MPQEKFSLEYKPELDGLRGVAILSVMGFHAYIPFSRGGFIGVEIFFVLSGFLITSALVAEFDRYGTVSLKQFYMRRVLRLAPALVTFLLIFCLVSFLFLPQDKATTNYVDAVISLVYLSNWARAFLLHPPDFLGHTWSLSIEEQFYILWPLLLLVCLRLFCERRSVILISFGVAISSWALRFFLYTNGATPDRLYNGSDTRADALMVGCAFGVAFASGYLEKLSHTKAILEFLLVATPVSALCLVWFFFAGNLQAPYMYQFGFLAISLLSAILLIGVIAKINGTIGRVLSMKPLVWVGSISYGLYLWHYPIYRAMFALEFGWRAVFTIGSLLTFLVATLSYYLIEKPVLRFKRHFSHKPPADSVQRPPLSSRSAEPNDA